MIPILDRKLALCLLNTDRKVKVQRQQQSWTAGVSRVSVIVVIYSVTLYSKAPKIPNPGTNCQLITVKWLWIMHYNKENVVWENIKTTSVFLYSSLFLFTYIVFMSFQVKQCIMLICHYGHFVTSWLPYNYLTFLFPLKWSIFAWVFLLLLTCLSVFWLVGCFFGMWALHCMHTCNTSPVGYVDQGWPVQPKWDYFCILFK